MTKVTLWIGHYQDTQVGRQKKIEKQAEKNNAKQKAHAVHRRITTNTNTGSTKITFTHMWTLNMWPIFFCKNISYQTSFEIASTDGHYKFLSNATSLNRNAVKWYKMQARGKYRLQIGPMPVYVLITKKSATRPFLTWWGGGFLNMENLTTTFNGTAISGVPFRDALKEKEIFMHAIRTLYRQWTHKSLESFIETVLEIYDFMLRFQKYRKSVWLWREGWS